MAMTSEDAPGDFVEASVKGAVKGLLEFSAEKIQELIEKHKQGALSFIEDSETIELVKSQKNRPEWFMYAKYVTDKNLRIQIQMGMVLKKLESDKQKLDSLRDKIRKKYNVKGLNVAELVQSGIFGKYVNLLLGEANEEKELENGIEQILSDIDKPRTSFQPG